MCFFYLKCDAKRRKIKQKEAGIGQYLKQTIGKNFHDLKQFVDELGSLIERSTSDKELAYDIDELSHSKN